MHLLVAAIALTASLFGQSRVSTEGTHRMEVVLERLESDDWKVIDPDLVLEKNDRVRFRFKANFPGYLYVTNQSTSAKTTLLFPRKDTGSENRITADKEYVVPATQGAFRVDGPPGYDVVSWLISPVELGRPETPERVTPPPATLLPRCDDTIFRARGACVDTTAGPQAKKSPSSQNDLTFIRQKQSSVISSSGTLRGPIVYEFHLAHR